MGIREDVLALADDVESTIGGCYGCLLDKRGLCKADSDFDCNDEVCKFVAHRLRAIVEHEAKDAMTVSAYDLLPDEDRKAIAWVREHGGLGAVEKRLMPEGMEWLIESWPRFDDNEPARWEDEYENGNGNASPLHHVSLYADGRAMLGKGKVKVVLAPGQRVKRPAPKVLDADGVEIRVGDTVYGFAGQQYEVTGLCEYEPSIVHAKTVGDGVAADELLALSGQLNSAQLDAFKLTHRAPVLAADGKPLKAGETVWDVESGTEYEVVSIYIDEENPVRVMRTDGTHLAKATKPDALTHTDPDPDTWERIEEDIGKEFEEYWSCKGRSCSECPSVIGGKRPTDWYGTSCYKAQAMDIMHRCKALVERGER